MSNKKKSRAAAPAPAPAAAAAAAAAASLRTRPPPLTQMLGPLAADALALPAALERVLWLHNVALLLVQHALLLSDERVTWQQALLLLWTALWLGRAHLTTCEPLAIGRRAHEKRARRRVTLAVGGAALQLVLLCVSDTPPRRAEHLRLLAFVYLLEYAALALLRRAGMQLTWPQVALAAVEAPFLMSVFSVLYSHREFLIYDRVAFALTAVSCSVHTAALLSAKLVARSTAPRDASTQWTQRRGRQLVAELRRAVALEIEAERDGSGASERVKQPKKKKGAKNSSPPPPSDALDSAAAGGALEAPASPSCSVSASLLQHASVRVAALVAAQCLLLLAQAALSAFFLFSWEIASVLMLSSSHVLYTLVQLHQALAAPPGAVELASPLETEKQLSLS